MVRVQLQRHKVSLIESQVCSLILYFFTFIEPTSANCFLCGSTKNHLYSFIYCPPARHLKKKFSRLVRKVAAFLLCEKKRFCDVSKLICLPRFFLWSHLMKCTYSILYSYILQARNENRVPDLCTKQYCLILQSTSWKFYFILAFAVTVIHYDSTVITHVVGGENKIFDLIRKLVLTHCSKSNKNVRNII